MAPLGEQIVLFGGTGASGLLSDTWSWDGTAWTEVPTTGPSPRAYAPMAPIGGLLVLFGGIGGSGALSDTWTWQAGNGSFWRQIVGTGPSAREPNPMVFLVGAPNDLGLDGSIVLFGGSGMTGSPPLGDTWIWDGAEWTAEHVPGPPGRSGAAMAMTGAP
jgi:hypothetical protein